MYQGFPVGIHLGGMIMKKKNRIIALFLAGILLLTTGCGKSTDSSAESTVPAETETVAITSHGVFTVEEGSEAEKELMENPPKEEEIQKSVYNLSETEVSFMEKNNIFMVFLNRAFIQTIPMRCLSDEEQQQVRSYFSEKGLD